jgi:hypothetical protein
MLNSDLENFLSLELIYSFNVPQFRAL